MNTHEAALIFAERYMRAMIATGIAWIALYAWLVSP
jgi:hypothetical protein